MRLHALKPLNIGAVPNEDRRKPFSNFAAYASKQQRRYLGLCLARLRSDWRSCARGAGEAVPMDADRFASGRNRPFLNTRQAAHFLGLSARHLERMRARGTGPVFRRHSRFVVYHIDDLNAWSRANSCERQDDA